ncbi:MAG: PAS domain-containing sensor histidine kinase, partial [Stellaceae bacterium]
MASIRGQGRCEIAAGGNDRAFEAVSAIAARLFQVRNARVWLAGDAASAAPEEQRLLRRALAQDSAFVLPDLAGSGLGGAGFFAAAPLVADDGRRFGTLVVSDPHPRPDLAASALGDLERLARLVVDEIELREAQDRLTGELASRRRAEARLNLANDITAVALAATDFHAAITACLKQVVDYLGAACGTAHGLAPQSGKLECEAYYFRPDEAALAPLLERIRATPFPVRSSFVARTVLEGRPSLLPDLRDADLSLYPILPALRDAGLRTFVAIPCENEDTRISLAFLFRRTPDDLDAVVETLQSLVGRVRDLLARKQTEEQIALLRSVVLHTGDAVAVSELRPGDALPRIVYVNPAFVRITGFAEDEVLDTPPTILRGPMTEAGALERLAVALKRPRVTHLGLHLHQKDGTPFWAETDVTPVADSFGAVRHWIAVIRDRTHDKAQAEAQRESELTLRDLAQRQSAVLEALRREKEFSDFLIRSTTEGILVFDRELKITLWNPGIETITAISAPEAIGRNALEALPFLVGTPAGRAMLGALEGEEASFLDQRYALPATGRHGYYEAYFSPLKSSAHDIIGGIGFLRETTERRRMEEELRQSQKMEAVGQLTGGIAHDFNNMLTVIAGNLELLEGKLGGDPRLSRLVNAASLAASRAEKLTQQLLTFSRRQQLRPQPVDLNQIVIGMDELLHRTVGETIEIRTALAADLLPARADPNQIETALLNLVLNARDAMPGGGRITIDTANVQAGIGHAELAPGAYAMLRIADTGCGMSEHVLAHVFEPFFTT